MDRKKLNKALKFQEMVLDKYVSFNYEELKKMKGRNNVASPEGLEDYSFAINIDNEKEFNAIIVEVFHYWMPDNSMFIDKMTKHNPETAKLFNQVTIEECRMSRWFWKHQDNNIEWPGFEFDPED